MKRSKIRRHSRKLSKRHASRKLARRSVRLSKKQRRSLRLSRKQKRLLKTYSRKLQSRLGIWDKVKSAVKMDDTSIAQRALKKEMAAVQKSAQTQFKSDLSEIKSNIASAQKRIDELSSLENKQNEMINLKTQQKDALSKQLADITKDIAFRTSEKDKSQKELTDLNQKVKDFQEIMNKMSASK